MPILTKRRKKHVAKVIQTKRKELFGYPGGNRILAEKIGVSAQLVSMWACNKRIPKDRELLALAEVFKIPLDELYPAGGDRACAAPAAAKRETTSAAVLADARTSMLEICDITTELVKFQKQMLTGKRSFKNHRDWLKRIKKYVDAL
ncbi:MAG: helix-turn-helix transcriptional regulator [Planctomycetota bacterium]|jgi:transcriptional regulator with XRE-family HTH domain|nr:helix-turn-helix transcriptional regulator [Planctomycetota bacterium]